MNCQWHLCKNMLNGKKIKFCSVKCKNKSCVDRFRKNLKLKAVNYKGGKCEICGYNKCIGVLQFHHIGGNKDFTISEYPTKSWDKIKKEIDKCSLLCANCHGEIHYGTITQPGRVAAF